MAKKTNPMEELVPVYLFKDGDKYKDDVFVAVNGESVLIQRGVQVNVKRKFAEVLAQQAAQDAKTANLISDFQSEYNKIRTNL